MATSRKKMRYESEWMRSKEAINPPMLLPSLGSVVFHIVVVVFVMTQMKACSTSHGIQALDESNVHEVGLYVKKPLPPTERPDDKQSENAATNPQKMQPIVDSKPPVPTTLPKDLANSLIAPGMMSSQSPSESIEQIATLPGAARPTTASAVPAGTVEFFNIKATGRSFVFVIDYSDSMGNFGALQVAKQQVLANINNLKPDQQFQIIFYNDRLVEMTNMKRKQELSFANSLNLTLAKNFINSQRSNGGTQHFNALMKGLDYGADVIFFLTDADTPGLTGKEMDYIRKKNRSRTEIHCVEFADGPDLKIENFLRQLSRITGGRYRYRNVRQFGQR